MEKKIWGGDRKSDEIEKSSHQSDDLISDSAKTNERLAKEYGVGTATIERNARFTKVVDMLPKEAKHDVLSGDEKISRTTTNAILKFDKPTQKKFIIEKNGITFLTICAVKKKPPNG